MNAVANQIEVAVREEVQRETELCKRRLAGHEKAALREQHEYDRLGKKADPVFRSSGDLTEKQEATIKSWQRAGDVLRSRHVAISRERELLRRLKTEDEVTRRLNQRDNQQLAKREMRGDGGERPARQPRQPREPQRKVSNMAARGTTVAIPDRGATIKACQEALKKFDGDAVKAAEHLNDRKVPTFRGVIGRWDASRVKYVAESDPSKGGGATKPASNSAAAKTRTPAKRGGNGNSKSAAKPMSKSAQASGTSRGGTGKKNGNGNGKSTTQAARSRTASRSGKPAARKPAARKPVTRRYGAKRK